MAHNTARISGNQADINSAVNVQNNFIVIGQGSSDDYSNSAASSFNAGATLYFYDQSPINRITGATITSANDWISSVTLPAGTYLLTAFFGPIFSASGNLFYVFHDGSNYLMPVAGVGGASTLSTDGGGIIQTSVTIGSTTTFSVVAYSKSNISVSIQGNSISEESFFIIEAL